MRGPWTEWSEEAAVERWLNDLETAEASGALVAERLRTSPLRPGDPREEAYRAAASRWLDRGRPRLALSLLERGESAVAPAADSKAAPGSAAPRSVAGQVDVLSAGLPGAAGLPAMLPSEMERIQAAVEPGEALRVLMEARRRLQAHGVEARALLRAWLAKSSRQSTPGE